MPRQLTFGVQSSKVPEGLFRHSHTWLFLAATAETVQSSEAMAGNAGTRPAWPASNAEIAASLGIAPKTASSHVEHILARLGATRRAEIATSASNVRSRSVLHRGQPVESATRV